MKVVIVGGGFGGVRCALDLVNKPGVEVCLISNKKHFEYHAALYRSATGRSPLEVVIPLSELFDFAKNVEVNKDKIEKIIPEDKFVVGASGSKYRYDTLVLALGSETQYFGIKGLREYSYGVGTVNEALELKRHIHETLVAGHEERNYVVVGAGPSGVELAAELASYVRKVRKRHNIESAFSVDLIEANERLLPSLKPRLSKRVTNKLKKMNISIYVKTAVKSETASDLKLPRGKISSQTVVWTAGITINKFFKYNRKHFEFSKNQRVEIDEYLQTQPNIYVIGDCAETEYSGTAQTAIHDARFVAKDIIKQLCHKKRLPYVSKHPIYAIPVGSRWSAVQWGHFSIFGYPGWILRRLADLRLFVNFLPLRKAISVWRYGNVEMEDCDYCK